MLSNPFSEIHNWGINSITSPIKTFIQDPILGTVADPIKWWSGMLDGGHPMARMAIDFLSAPGKLHFSILLISLLTYLFSYIC